MGRVEGCSSFLPRDVEPRFSSSSYTTVIIVKGTVSVISSDPPFKDGNVRFTTVPLKSLNLIKNVEDTVVILTRSVISVSFCIASYKQELRKLL